MPVVLPYRLSIAPSLVRFAPELALVCRFLDRCYLVERSEAATVVLHYGPNPPPGAVTVPASFFPDAIRIDEDGLHPERDGLARFENGFHRSWSERKLATAPLQQESGERTLRYDALGLMFMLLSRIEERGHPASATDRYGRFPYHAAFLHRLFSLEFPLTDIAAEHVASALLQDPAPPKRTTYTVHLTHDMDMLRGYHTPLAPIRRAAADILLQRDWRSAFQRIHAAYFTGEPWRSVRLLMELSEQRGLKSRFFFMGPSSDTRDSPYVSREPRTLRGVASEVLARGHGVGFHPGFRARRDPVEWRRQRDGLEKALDVGVAEGRHHGLLFDIDTTWDIWNDATMTADMTLGFPERSGFRSGTCRAHPTYSLRQRRTLQLLEYPSNILDFGFFGGRYRDLSVENALEECRRVVAVSRRFNGDMVVLYHTGNLRPMWLNFYTGLLPLL